MKSSAGSWSVVLLLGLGALGCAPGGVGDPCVPEDEYQQTFNGFQVTEVNVESRSFQCETRLCLVNHFQGRVSCSAGQLAANSQPYELDANGKPDKTKPIAAYDPTCSIPGTAASKDHASKDNINVEVPAQLLNRQTDQAVYCSCRCDGDDPNARYCECPEGFQCTHLVDDLQVGSSGGQLTGSYCIRSGSDYDPTEHFKGGATCRPGTDGQTNCGCDPCAEEYPATCGKRPEGVACQSG
jgi:hypothetical protein